MHRAPFGCASVCVCVCLWNHMCSVFIYIRNAELDLKIFQASRRSGVVVLSISFFIIPETTRKLYAILSHMFPLCSTVYIYSVCLCSVAQCTLFERRHKCKIQADTTHNRCDVYVIKTTENDDCIINIYIYTIKSNSTCMLSFMCYCVGSPRNLFSNNTRSLNKPKNKHICAASQQQPQHRFIELCNN